METEGTGVSPSRVRARAADFNGEPVHKGIYSAYRSSGSLYGCIPADFARQYDLEQSSELDVYADYELGCVMIFPKGGLSDDDE